MGNINIISHPRNLVEMQRGLVINGTSKKNTRALNIMARGKGIQRVDKFDESRRW